MLFRETNCYNLVLKSSKLALLLYVCTVLRLLSCIKSCMYAIISWVEIACNQHLVGLLGGRVDRSDLTPGVLRLQLLYIQYIAYSRAVYTEYSVHYEGEG